MLINSSARWDGIGQLRGWTIVNDRDFDEAQEAAALKRHPDNWAYRPPAATDKLSDDDEMSYGRLNDQLHEKITQQARIHFSGTPIPEAYAESGKDLAFSQQIGTAFTYQNRDWYGPSYEVYLCVLTDYVSASLLSELQNLLQGDHRDWCIVIAACDSIDFETAHEIPIFSDEILVSESAANAMNVP